MELCEIEPTGETVSHFQAYCPFHDNNDSAAWAIDKYNGLWTCFNPMCMEAGNLVSLLRRLRHMSEWEAEITIAKSNGPSISHSDKIARALERPVEFQQFDVSKMEHFKKVFWDNEVPMDYMHDRGFNAETLLYFEIGFSPKHSYINKKSKRIHVPDLIATPMHDPDGMLVGFVGRSIEGKIFKNSYKLPKAKTLWNYHRARKHETVIICESCFDAMRIHQAGYPNVVALLGGSASEWHLEQLDRTFSTIIHMTDFDKKRAKPNCRVCKMNGVRKDSQGIACIGHRAGRDLSRYIIKNLPNKRHRWGAFDDTCVYPHNAKDSTDMTDAEIRKTLKGTISNLEYVQWDIESLVA